VRSRTKQNSWYSLQAFRALNQATGRCIRHSSDYGAIVLLGKLLLRFRFVRFGPDRAWTDDRFLQKENLQKLSKWMRNAVQLFDGLSPSLNSLHAFFHQHEQR
jgi:Fanconi anemia group J protein